MTRCTCCGEGLTDADLLCAEQWHDRWICEECCQEARHDCDADPAELMSGDDGDHDYEGGAL